MRSPLAMALLGGLLYWIALPPIDLSILAWVAPMPWIWLVEQPALAGRRPWASLWLGYFGFWLAALHWLVLPHWATGFGLLALAFYLAWYLPAFVALARLAVHRFRVPTVLAVPVVWVGLELLQSYLLTGFTMVMLGQTQYRWISLIQIADLTGTYGLSFAIMLVAACLCRLLPQQQQRRFTWWPVATIVGVYAVLLGYGLMRTSGTYTRPGPTVALIQGDIGTELKADQAKSQAILDEYRRLTQRALSEARQLDLIVWPETMFRYAWFTFSDDYVEKPGEPYSPEQLTASSEQAVKNVAVPVGVPMLLGVDRWHQTAAGMQRYNTALFVNARGEVLGDYAKRHLVMFGEYVPFARHFPFLYKLTPLGSGSEPGSHATAVDVNGVCYCPSICFETTLSRVIRGLVNEASQATDGCQPEVLVNLTNDGWFWGSAELDMHLICGVFRAVECRLPLVIAANTGFSASISSDGRIEQQSRRMAEDVIIARPALDDRTSFYLQYGDVFAWPCLLACAGLAGAGLVESWRNRRRRPATLQG